jgi:hypothetical protein
MCGRYVSPEEAEIERFWHIGRHNSNPFGRRFNVAPTSIIPILRLDRATGEIELTNARWGLIPSWWKEPKPPRTSHNTRFEEAATKPMWKVPLGKSRCLVPALGWYEWVRHEVACVIVRRAPPDRTCRPIGSSLRGMAIRQRIVKKPSDNVSRRQQTGTETARGRYFCQHRGGSGLGRVVWSADANLRKYRQPRKSQRCCQALLRQARVLHSHPSWARRPPVYEEGPKPHDVTHAEHGKPVSLPSG